MGDDTSIWQIVFGAGGAAFLVAAWQAVKEWREGSDTRKDKGIKNLVKWRNDSDMAREWSDKQRAWWLSRAGQFEYELTRNGIPVPPPKEPFPTRPDGKSQSD